MSATGSNFDSIVYLLEDASALGGVKKHVEEAGAEFLERGYKVSVISRFHAGSDLLAGSIPIESIHSERYSELARAGDGAFAAEVQSERIAAGRRWTELTARMNERTLCIAVQYGCLYDIDTLGILEPKNRPFSVIGAYHSSWQYASEQRYYGLLLTLLRKCDAAVFLTEHDRVLFEAAEVTNSVAIPNAIKPGNPIPLPKRTEDCVYMGRLDREKGVEELVSCWTDPRYATGLPRLSIYGSGALEETLRKQIQAGGAEDKVRLMGVTEDPLSILANARVVVSCSPNEGFPMMLLEGASCGTPAVVYDAGPGTRELVKAHSGGYVVDTGDRESFVYRISDLFADDAKWQEMSEGALSGAGDYTPEVIYRKWEQLFTDLQKNNNVERKECDMSNTRTQTYNLTVRPDLAEYRLVIQLAREPRSDKAFVFAFRFFDASHDDVSAEVSTFPISSFFGAPFLYVPGSSAHGNGTLVKLSLDIPAEVRYLEISCHNWDDKTPIENSVLGVFAQVSCGGRDLTLRL